MKLLTITFAALLVATSANAGAQHGAHFIGNWDNNNDGIVTLAEATEKRGNIFLSFDENDDGFLSAEDYAMFDEARKNDQENTGGAGRGGKAREGNGMTLEFNDVNGDGKVSRDEFMLRTPDWFSNMDRNNDGTVTSADFGPQN